MHPDGPNLNSPDFDLERRTAYRFGLIADLSMRCLAEMFTRRHDLTTAMWQVLAIIGRYEPMYPTDVASRTAMHPDKVTRTVDSLVDAGWVERTPDAADRRRIVLRLTAKGHETHKDIDHIRRIIEAEFVSVLSKSETRTFKVCMDKLEARAEALFRQPEAWKDIVGRHEPDILKAKRKAVPRKK